MDAAVCHARIRVRPGADVQRSGSRRGHAAAWWTRSLAPHAPERRPNPRHPPRLDRLRRGRDTHVRRAVPGNRPHGLPHPPIEQRMGRGRGALGPPRAAIAAVALLGGLVWWGSRGEGGARTVLSEAVGEVSPAAVGLGLRTGKGSMPFRHVLPSSCRAWRATPMATRSIAEALVAAWQHP